MWEMIIPLLGKVFDKVIPDPQAAADAKLKVMQLMQNGDLAVLNADIQQITGQTDTNKVEAANTSIFVAGWRPFIGWICGSALGYEYILQPLLAFGFAAAGHPVTFPKIEDASMNTILMGMLGLGGLRTYEKVKGAA